MHRPAFLSVLIATAFLLSSAAPVGAATPTEVAVSQAWVKASSYSDHVGGMTGVFGTITNKSKKTITLEGGTSSFARALDVHQVVNGVMSHKPGGLQIKPGKSVTLEPGGLHLMLMGLTKRILPGTKVDIRLTFKGVKPVALNLTAKSVPAGTETYAPAPMATPTSSPISNPTSNPTPSK